MSLFEENSKFAPLVENDNRVKMEDIETVFKSYGENVALLIKEYHNYFEWEASSTIAPEPAYVNNTKYGKNLDFSHFSFDFCFGVITYFTCKYGKMF